METAQSDIHIEKERTEVISPKATCSTNQLNWVRQPGSPDEPGTHTKNLKILIVDDEERNIRLLNAMLSSENYELISIFSGEEALRAVAGIRPDLIDNAIRHTPEKGEIEISIDPMPRNGSGCVVVKDNGEGLAPEFHAKIFEPFEQVALKRAGVKLGSSGLGLAFCKMAVEAHNGEIWVESAGEGTGSTFRFTLPLNQQSEQK